MEHERRQPKFDFMKILISLLSAAVVLAAVEFSSSAQISIQAGATMPYYRQIQINPLAIAEGSGVGAYVGFDCDIHITDSFSISPGLFYNYASVRSGGQLDGILVDERQEDHMVNIPVHLKYEFNFKPGKFAMYLYGGPVVSVGISSFLEDAMRFDIRDDSYNIIYEDLMVDFVYDNYSGVVRSLNVPDLLGVSASDRQLIMENVQKTLDDEQVKLSRLDLQLDWGVGFRFLDRLEVRAGYSFGLLDRFFSYYNKYNLKTSQYYIGLGYRF